MAAGVPPSALAGNLVLGPLPEPDRTRLARRLVPYRTDHEVLVAAGGTIGHAWFPTSGLISVVAALRDGKRAEIATVGREGMAGLPLFLGSRTSLYEIVAQVSGEGFSLPADEFVEEVGRTPALRERLLRYSEARMAMLGQTAACNAAHPIRSRLARWLLISHDSVEGDTFELTHEFLSTMLGAERPTVTVAAGVLQKTGAITYKRGAVNVLDRAKLEKGACECYGIVRREIDRLMNGGPRPH
ncbi:MAG TPA: Crp/Fnr family transcriptional regulator [Candidatus Limnocylindria bacterium]|nr:Crp/Fnr family transcriptional regulator [Candidatus Limnocylindria bacterium]